MREFRELNDTELKTAYNAIYKEAFPPKELKPLFSMRRMAREGSYRTLGWFEDGEAIGYTSLWTEADGYILLDYIAVPKEKRGGGIGAALLEALLDYHPPGTVFMIESEAPETAEDGMAERRIAFYRRCGASPLGFDSGLWGVHYKLFALSRAPVDESAVLAHYDALYRRHIPKTIWKKAVRIPLAAGETAPKYDRREESL